MKKLLIVIFLFCSVSGCQRKEPVFTLVEKNKRIAYMYGDKGDYFAQENCFLVENKPKKKFEFKKIMIYHFLHSTSSIDSLHKHTDLDRSLTTFLNSTSITRKYYIDKEENVGDDEWYNNETYLGSVFMDRCKKDEGKSIITVNVSLGTADFYEFKQRGPDVETDTLLNECDSTWYIRNKDNELVRYFMSQKDSIDKQ